MSYEDDDEDEESDGMMLSLGEDGVLSEYNPEDYVEMLKSEAEMLEKFIEENQESFDKFCKEYKK